MPWSWSCERPAGRRRKPKQGARFAHWPGEVRAARPERAGPQQSPRLAWVQDVLAAGRVPLETETSKEQVDRGHFWPNVVHQRVGELTAADTAVLWGSTPNAEKAGKRSGLRQGGDVPNESRDATLVI